MLGWAGHVARIPDQWQSKRFFYGDLLPGVRSHGGQKKRFKDTLTTSMKAFNINCDTHELLLRIELDGTTLFTKVPIHVKNGGQLWMQRKKHARKNPHQQSSGCLPHSLSEPSSHIPCTQALGQPPAYPQIDSPPPPLTPS